MTQLYHDILVDLETTGTDPVHNQILQIAAVKFDLATGAVGDVFDQALAPIPGRFWDEDTRNWWLKDKRPILQGLFQRQRDATDVLKEFSQWCERDTDPYVKLRFWAKPISFDFPFLSSYFKQLEVKNPFHFRNAIDQNTWLHARHFPNDVPNYEGELIPFEGPAHNALFDCFHQLKVIFRCYNDTK